MGQTNQAGKVMEHNETYFFVKLWLVESSERNQIKRMIDGKGLIERATKCNAAI